MRAVLPGQPQAKLQAVCTTGWEGQRLVSYISGNALVILGGPHNLLQTIYHDGTPDLDAVAIDEATAKIATSSGNVVYIYSPKGSDRGALKWSLHHTLTLKEEKPAACTLSWGALEELLVGSSSLRLFETEQEASMIWDKRISSPVKFARFSHDATLIASTGGFDRLVKIWRRLSFGSDDVRFDSTYLHHPTTVTSLHWRRPHHREQTIDNVLYTICADNKIRVWAPTDPHGLQVLQLWAEIDMLETIQPRNLQPSSQSSDRYAFIIDSRDFSTAAERAVEVAKEGENEHHALEHIIEVANRSPEVCVVLDSRGHMSAWGLENVGARVRENTNIFNIAHVEKFRFLFPNLGRVDKDYVQFFNFCDEHPRSAFTLLVHHFDSSIEWLEGRVDEVFDPSPREDRLTSRALWTGHDGAIKKIVRNASGKALVSRTNDNEGLIWKQEHSSHGTILARSSALNATEHIHRTCLLQDGDFVVNLHHHSITLWDARSSFAKKLSSCTYNLVEKPLCLLLLPEHSSSTRTVHLAAITSKMTGIVWEIRLPSKGPPITGSMELSEPTLVQFCAFDLDVNSDLAFMLPVDPAGSPAVISGFLDIFAKDIAISYTNDGLIRSWTAKIDLQKSTVDWLETSTIETGIHRPSLASGSSIRKIAVVDASRNGLTIWDSSSAQLEYEAHYRSQEVIQDLDWSSTPDDQSILAVGFPHKVVILSQMRYDYINAGAAWAPVREICIGESTPHPIGDSVWLASGDLVVGAGNQLFVYDKKVDLTDDITRGLTASIHGHASKDIFEVVMLLNGPLPVFHPQFLAQCILAGKLAQVQKIIIGLYKALKFFVDGDRLDSFVGIPITEFYNEQPNTLATEKKERSSYNDFSDDDEPETVTEALAVALNENLAKTAVPQLTGQEQIHLVAMIECVATAEKHRRSMDDNAMRYLLFFRQYMLRKGHLQSNSTGITWREIAWAYHSNSQDILVDLVSKQFQGKVLWEHARESGMFMWMTDISALRTQFENMARNEYTKTDEKNPIDCSLFYLALKKKNVLLGLWRMAAWNREQSATQKLLSNDFRDARWKTAALKNAYALMGKRRFEYAAAFFLLAGNLRDAVNVCAQQMQDLQLAIAVARVYEGDDGSILRELLEDKVLPQAASEGNRWLATWAFWMLGRRDMAVRVLISPVYTLLESPETPPLQAKSYLANDPALVLLYKQLRDKTLQTLKGASKISPRAEWEFVTQNARLYDRMGCDLLALDLVRNWEFLNPPSEPRKPTDGPPDPRKMLRRRSSLVVDDLPVPKSPKEMKSGFGKPPAKVFEEPDANSLLDSFGF